jgi:hypothetical protein
MFFIVAPLNLIVKLFDDSKPKHVRVSTKDAGKTYQVEIKGEDNDNDN